MNDLISRKEAIEWVQNILATHLYYHPCSKSRNVPIDEVIDRLERVPSIDAVPVKDGTLKARSGNYVTYRIDWLLDNLAQEISLLEGYRRGRKEDG